MKWRFALKSHPPNPWQFLRVRSDDVVPCEANFLDSFEDFCRETRSEVFSEILKTRGRTKHARNGFSNCFGVKKLGLILLKGGPYKAIRTDKDGGFALVAKNQVLPQMLRILSNSQRYCEVSRPPDFCDSVVRGFVDVVCCNLTWTFGRRGKNLFPPFRFAFRQGDGEKCFL